MKLLDKRVIRISIYMIIALTSSFLFRYDILGFYKNWKLSPILFIYKSLLEGLGPFVGAFFVTFLFKVKRNITFLGIPKLKSFLMIITPIILLLFFGVKNDIGLNKHLYGMLLGFWIILYGIAEETGWRGYLQDELSDYKPIIKYSIVGVFWYIWHLTFLGNTNILNEIFILFILVISSFGIGIIADKTKSIFAASCFHIIGNLIGLSPLLNNAFKLNVRIIIVVICVIIWIIIMRISIKGKNIKLKYFEG